MQTAFFVACGLLLIGFVMRATIRPLQTLHIPASVAGGLVGLAIAQGAGIWLSSLEPEVRQKINVEKADTANVDQDDGDESAVTSTLRWIKTDLVNNLKSWPGWLIAVLFGGLLLEKKDRPSQGGVGRVGREGIVVWIIVLGQTAVGLAVTWLILQPFFDLPNSFGMIIEAGFAGGHGTAGAMGVILEDGDQVLLPHGRDLCMFMATIGLAFSVISGIIYVNLAVRRGWTRRGDIEAPRLTGLENRSESEPAAFAKVRGEVLDPIVFQALILASAVVVGYGLQQIFSIGIGWIEGAFESTDADSTAKSGMSLSRFAGNVPLFIFTLMGGLIVRKAMDWLKVGDLIDPYSIRRLTAACMEFLVVAAITSLNLTAIREAAVPLAIMLVAAFAWTAFCLLFISRRLLPRNYWFELGVINYGMSTGTTATGFVLLRIVDKELDSGAAEDYALAAPLSAPFVGGGIITLGLPLLVLQSVPIGVVVCVLWAVIIGLYFGGRHLASQIESNAPSVL